MSTSATSSISSMLNSRTRVSGYASGLDTDSIVEKLMKVETAKVDRVKKQKTYLEWQKDGYRSFTTSLTALKNKYLNITSSSNLFSSSAFNKVKTTVSDSSVLSVSGSSASGTATHTVGVSTIATVGATYGNVDKTITTSSKVSDLLGAVPADGTELLTITNVDGVNNPSPFTFKADETIGEFITRVNSDSKNTSFRLSFDTSDAANNRIILTAKNTGKTNATISGTFLDSANVVPGNVNTNAQNAVFTIDGIQYESTSNTFTADGLTYTFLKGGSQVDTNTGKIIPQTTNVVASRDIDSIVTNIQNFITDYNNIISDINTKTAEKKESDYQPLTDDEKSDMKDSDITLWETKAKQGILENDTLLLGLGDKLKQAMYSKYTLSDGTTQMSLNDIGIGTTSRYDMGVLTVNETKLREALTDNPDKVKDLFTREYFSSADVQHSMYDPDGDNSTREQNSGLLTKVFDILSDYVRTNGDSNNQKGFLLERAGATNDTTDTDNYISKLISEKEDEISELTDKLTEKEDYYYSKFTAMETAINNMNSQASFLSSLNGNS